MKFSSPTSLLLNLGHALDHWVLAIFLYTVSVIAGVWVADWKELTPYAFGASFMFGAGSIVSGKLGDQWGRRAMMILFFAGMGLSCLVIALCQNKWQIGVALTVMGAFASVYHPVGIPMLVQRAERPGLVIGVNGLIGNLGIAIGSSVSVLLATRFGWQMAYIVPGMICLVGAVLFAVLVPREQEAPAKRKSRTLDLPPGVMARIFFIMTCAAVSGSIVFNFTTNSNGEMLKARLTELAADPWLLSLVLLGVFTVASLAQIGVGMLIDRFPLKAVYLPIVVAQIPLFMLAAYADGWGLVAVTTLFMVFVFGAIPFTDAMIVRYVDDRLRSRVTGMRLAIGFGVSSLVVAAIGPSVKAAGFPTLLMMLAGVAACTVIAIAFLPSEREHPVAALKPAE
ncbi:Predicted arabinose efflux permease, MFS family [Enhydrobacter aerosaccus]|uniref:Predicted arabinose efflux permease, MFS family n=1 Tax=Enhydrobacter aerosaccus TaxID=225324 RepID=A0A1T4K295_9HYPH|nr:MFS transporter [Enhydrobacter aerosaccus]SJZ36425.1 Predicted arabinose efflux permease, MFS family [Enhydrobacter aerosaccus]